MGAGWGWCGFGLAALAACSPDELDRFEPPRLEGARSALFRALRDAPSVATHAVDLSAPVAFLDEHAGPVEADAFLYRASLAKLGLEAGEVPPDDGLRVAAPDGAFRRALGAWRPLDPGEVLSSRLRQVRSRHDVVSCSEAGGCFLGADDACEVPCRSDDAPVRPRLPAAPAPPAFACPEVGWVERQAAGATVCDPELEDGDCPTGTFAHPGAIECVDLDRDGPWPEPPAGMRIVYVGPGATGSGASEADPMALNDVATLSEPVVVRLLTGTHFLRRRIPPGSVVQGLGSSPLRMDAPVGLIAVRLTHLPLAGKADLTDSSSVTFDGVWTHADASAVTVSVSPSAHVAFVRSDLDLGDDLLVQGRLVVADSRIHVQGIPVDASELVLRRTAVRLTAGGVRAKNGARVRLTEVTVERTSAVGLEPLLEAIGEGAELALDRVRARLPSGPAGSTTASVAAVRLWPGEAPPKGSPTGRITRLAVEIASSSPWPLVDGISADEAELAVDDAVIVGGHRGIVLRGRGAKRARIARAAVRGSAVGLALHGADADVSDLTIDEVRGPEPRETGRGIALREGSRLEGRRIRVRGAPVVALSVGRASERLPDGSVVNDAPSDAGLDDVELEGSMGDGVSLFDGNAATLRRARVGVGEGRAIWSEAPIELREVTVSSSSASSRTLIRLCEAVPPEIAGLVVDAPARTGTLLDVVPRAFVDMQLTDLDLRGAGVGVRVQNVVSHGLRLVRARIRGTDTALAWSQLRVDYFGRRGTECEFEPTDEARAVPKDAGLAKATWTLTGVTVEDAERCFGVERPEDLLGANAERLRAVRVGECPARRATEARR